MLTAKELKVRYQNSFLGYFWSVAHPLALACVFYVAFKLVIRIPVEHYALFLITALFPWQWLANSLTAAPVVYPANTNILKKVAFPRSVLPLSGVVQDGVQFLFSVPVIVLFVLVEGGTPSWTWLWGLPLLAAIQFVLVFGLCLAVAAINLFFRDLERIVTILLTIGFYFTPILYPLAMVPEAYQGWALANPLAPLMLSWRSLWLEGTLSAGFVAWAAAAAVLAMAAGYALHRRLAWRIVEVL